MKKKRRSELYYRYFEAKRAGREPYLDADELEELLEELSLLEEDLQPYNEVLAFGLSLHPNNEELNIRLARNLIIEESYSEAWAILQRFGDIDNVDIIYLKMEALSWMEQYEELFRFTKEVLRQKTKISGFDLASIASLLTDMEQYEVANAFIQLSLDHFPKEVALMEELCFLLEMEGKIAEAIVASNRLIDLNPYDADNWFNLGRLYAMNSEYEKAIEALDFALTTGGENFEATVLKATCLYMNESYDKALNVFKLLTDNPHFHRSALPLLADCYIKLEQWEEAYLLLKPLLANRSEIHDASIYINYITCCIETSRPVDVLKLLQDGAQQFPSDVTLLTHLALTYMEKGEDQLALDTIERIVVEASDYEDPDLEDLETLFLAGRFMLDIEEEVKALNYFRQIETVNPHAPNLAYWLALSNKLSGNEKEYAFYLKQLSDKERREIETWKPKLSIADKDALIKKENNISRKISKHLSADFLNNKENNN